MTHRFINNDFASRWRVARFRLRSRDVDSLRDLMTRGPVQQCRRYQQLCSLLLGPRQTTGTGGEWLPVEPLVRVIFMYENDLAQTVWQWHRWLYEMYFALDAPLQLGCPVCIVGQG